MRVLTKADCLKDRPLASCTPEVSNPAETRGVLVEMVQQARSRAE